MGYRKMPQKFVTALEDLESDQYIVSAVKYLKTQDEVMNLRIFQQLSPSYKWGENVTIVPAWSFKSWVKWNHEGRLVSRKDLPKISKSFYWEARNFGREDTHSVHVTRKVWQKENLHGRSMELTVKATPVEENGFRITVDADFPFDRDTSPFNPDLLMAASLVQEAISATPFPRPSNLSREQWEESFQISWEFFSVSEFDAPNAIFERLAGTQGTHLIDESLMEERVAMIQDTCPSQILLGTSGKTRYIGYKYKEDLVALENFFYGNALYVLYKNWSDLSKKTRTTLINSHIGEIDRIVHRGNWRDKFARILTAHGHSLDAE